MPGTLYIVATPIGNLEDISLRAIRVLGEVALIAAEDTRRTSRLLEHYGIQTPTLSYHEHNSRSRLAQLMRRLEDGASVALVTDAGTPGISDPGTELVDACLRRAVPVDPIPGASALLTAVMASGFPPTPLTWLGFSPHRAKALERWYATVAAIPHAVCFLESPHRIEASLQIAADVLGDRPMFVGRELTKVHQQLVRASSREVLSRLSSLKGEFTIVVGPAEPAVSSEVKASDSEILTEFGQMAETDAFTSKRRLAAALAEKHGRPVREIYALVSKHTSSAD